MWQAEDYTFRSLEPERSFPPPLHYKLQMMNRRALYSRQRYGISVSLRDLTSVVEVLSWISARESEMSRDGTQELSDVSQVIYKQTKKQHTIHLNCFWIGSVIEVWGKKGALTFITSVVFPWMRLKQIVSGGQLKRLRNMTRTSPLNPAPVLAFPLSWSV